MAKIIVANNKPIMVGNKVLVTESAPAPSAIGTWVINEHPVVAPGLMQELIDFTSNSKYCTTFIAESGPLIQYVVMEGATPMTVSVYYDSGSGPAWVNAAYRTVTFTSEASADFLAWLNANAVKQN